MKVATKFILLVFAFTGLSCTDIIPEITALSGKSKAITFNGQDSLTVNVKMPSEQMAIQGECNTLVSKFEIKFKENGQWKSLGNMAASAPSLNCSDMGKFSFTLQSLGQITTANWQSPQDFHFWLRGGDGQRYFEDQAQLTLRYAPVENSNPNNLAFGPGSGTKSNGNYKIKAQFGALQGRPASNGNFSIRNKSVQ